MEDWNLYDSYFITQCQDNGYVLKLRSSVHDEEIYETILKQHGKNIALIGIYGRSVRHSRERLLGYVLVHVGKPFVHANTWYVYLAYSEPEDINRKWPEPVKADKHIRLYAAGVGKFDYLFVYKAKTREHDELGFSDAATHRETADQWRDGL